MSSSKNSKNSGFTIIEVLVLVIIVLILAAIVLPRFFDLENATRHKIVQENMKIMELAVKRYADNTNGIYPLKPDDAALRSFFPGGNHDAKNPEGGNYPENPFTHMREEPLLGNVTDVKQARQSSNVDLGGPRVAGKIFYNALIPTGAEQAIGYVIEGADKSGKAISGPMPNTTYVLSNLPLPAAQSENQ